MISPAPPTRNIKKKLRARRRGLALMIAMTGLALLGAAGAFGYREMFGGSVLPTPPPTITASNEPHKVAPPASSQKQRQREPSRCRYHRLDRETGLTRRAASHDCAAESGSARIAAPRQRAGRDRSGGSEPSNAARSGGCGPSGASSYHCHSVAACWPIGCGRRHGCGEPRACGCRPHRTCRSEQPCGGNPSCYQAVVMRFRLRRNAVKARLKPRSGRCKRNTPTSLAAANRSFAARISAQRAPTIGFLSVPLRRRRRRQDCAAD